MKNNFAYIIHTNIPSIPANYEPAKGINWIPFQGIKPIRQGMSTHEEWYWIYKNNETANKAMKEILKLNENSNPKMKLKKIRINLNKEEIPLRFEGSYAKSKSKILGEK